MLPDAPGMAGAARLARKALRTLDSTAFRQPGPARQELLFDSFSLAFKVTDGGPANIWGGGRAMDTPRIFISMGTPYNEQYSQFRDALETLLRDGCKTDPRIIGKNEYPSGSPLEKIRDVMRGCQGVLIVAYERKFVEAGVERRGGTGALQIARITYTTPWNHIESAMAYSLGIPLYVICQNGLAQEGLIESKLDWYVQNVEISKETLARPEVIESIRAWVETRVVPRTKGSHHFRAINGQLKLSEMTPQEIGAVMSVITGAFASGVAVATFLPKLFH